MAIWRLDKAHYLNVPGTEWEYKEVDRGTGKQKRLTLPVPMFLEPMDPADWTHILGKDEGEIRVTNKVDTSDPKAIRFLGNPTPDMTPLDDEAREISAKLAPTWNHPIESLPGQFSQSLIDKFQAQMAEAGTKPTTTIVEGLPELMATMAAMMKQNQELIATLAAARAPEGAISRRA